MILETARLEAAKLAAASNEWGAISPELTLGCLALLLLALEIVLPSKERNLIPAIALGGQIVVLGALLYFFQSGAVGTDTFGGLLHHSLVGQALRVFFVVAGILVTILGQVSLAKQKMPRIEFYHTVIVVTAAMMLLAQANHFVLLFVTLETLTVGLYILVSYYRGSALTLEAGLKYLVMGALSSSLLLFGIALLYGAAGNPMADGHALDAFNFEQLQRFLAHNPHNFLASAGIVLVLAGVGFKIGAFPFQIWIPDVYQGAPTPITAFLAVASKAAGFAVLLTLVSNVFVAYAWLVTPVLTAMAAATILFGNLAALTQSNVKRLIGLSGVSHAGFLLMGVVAVAESPQAVGAVLFYLFAYLFASFAVFGVMTHLAGEDDADQQLDHYASLAKDSPFLAAVLAVGLGSLAGIPPLAGFMGKFLVFVAAAHAHLYGLLIVAIVGVVISIYYYFGWIKAAFFATWVPSGDPAQARPPRTPVGRLAGTALATVALCSILFGLYQGPLGAWLLAR